MSAMNMMVVRGMWWEVQSGLEFENKSPDEQGKKQ
jgi:hypothetical protein